MQDVRRQARRLYSARDVARALDRMAAELTPMIENTNPVVLAVMHGGAFTAIELCKRFRFAHELDYVHVTRYRGKTRGGAISWRVRPRSALRGRTVLVVDDILDHGKTLRAAKQGGDPVRLCTLGTPEQEAKFVAKEIRGLRAESMRAGDIAVLYRSNLQARAIEEELRVEGIPYRVVGGTQFFEKKEVKDALAYLRVVANPRDELSLRRILNYPSRGIGDATIERLERFGKARRHTFAYAALDALDRNANSIPEYASLAKARAGETVHLATNELVQMHGGIGMTDAHDAGLYLKRARVAEALYGSAAFHRDRYASLLGF